MRLVRAEDLVTEPQNLHTFDLATMSCADQDFSATFQLRPRPGSAGAQGLHGQCPPSWAMILGGSRDGHWHRGLQLGRGGSGWDGQVPASLPVWDPRQVPSGYLETGRRKLGAH